MKTTIKFSKIFTLLIILLISACQSAPTDEQPQDLASLKKVLLDKKTQAKELSREIETLQEKINLMDEGSKPSKSLVTIIPAKKTDFKHYVTVQGNVTSDDIVNATSEVGGRILELTVEEGDYVKKGELIARVDLESIDKQIAELQKSLELSTEIFERQSRLWDQKIGSEIQYLQAKNNKERQEKSLETLEHQLTKGNVYAPISGAVDHLFLKEGEVAGPGAPVVQILNTGTLKVVADAPEDLLGSVRKGDIVQVYFPAFDETQDSRVTLLGRSIDPANRTFKIEAGLRNTNGLLKPNLLSELRINDYTEEDVIVIPLQLVQQEVGGNDYVLIRDGNEGDYKAKKVYVETGDSYDGDVVIKSGLNETDILIKDGARSVTDQELIAVTEPQIAVQ